MAKYQIFTDSSSDLSTEMRKASNVDYLHFGLTVDQEQYNADLDWKEYSIEEFYGWLSAGRKCKTSLVSMEECLKRIRPLFEKGIDVIFICCSSKLTGSLQVFNLAKEELLAEFPERKMIGIDALISSLGLGLLTLDAAKKRDEGLSIEELAEWVESNKLKYNMFATVDTLSYLRASGRITGAKAFFGNIMGVKPIFISDKLGNNYTIGKVKGTKASIEELIRCTKEAFVPGETDKILIGHGMCLDRAEKIKAGLEDLGVPIIITDIGPIVGTSCGPGVLATFLRGPVPTRYEGEGKE